MAGAIRLVATPLGNLGDLSPRASRMLSEADAWLVEDTRVSGKLQSVLGVRKPMRLLNEHTTPATIEGYLDEVEAGLSLAVLTDAGTPCVSDPGAALVDGAHERRLLVDLAPGPSAVTAALALSGFFAQRFVFLGFLGRKPGDMRRELVAFASSPLTLVAFESPFRLERLLEAVSEVLGSRRYAVCRELSKAHQQVHRARTPAIPPAGEVPRKGELTVVVEGLRRSLDMAGGRG
jgi:16S rRNA (cytidine1402-2'-O)-methyltransferase